MGVSARHTGWRYDPDNSRLDFYYQGTRVGHINASDFSATNHIGVTDIADDILTGDKIANSTDGNTDGAIMVVHEITVANSTAASTNSLTVNDKIEVVDAWIVKTGGSASTSTGTESIAIQTSTGGAITDAMDISKADGSITRAGTISDALYTIAAAGTIKAVKVTTTTSVNSACRVYVVGRKVA